ncbi:MAG TPA: TonB-dependent receptor, partial [Bacteroidota bacterium]|nr:TonB-dependent receptor [Bacteroidota bacterium]
VEGYYKLFRHLLDFKNEISYSTDVSDLFYVGSGRAYGAELFIQKKAGDFTGIIGYSLAWTFRQYPELNDGEEFEPKYDRRHDLSVALNYQLDENWKLGMVFTYATGQAYTDGVGRYDIDINGRPYEITLPGKLFNKRLSPYHRADVSVTKRATLFGLHGSWYVQVYNVYNRRNVWFKEFDNSRNPPQIADVKLLPIIPTFGFDFTF